jgi:hypothetical protein
MTKLLRFRYSSAHSDSSLDLCELGLIRFPGTFAPLSLPRAAVKSPVVSLENRKRMICELQVLPQRRDLEDAVRPSEFIWIGSLKVTVVHKHIPDAHEGLGTSCDRRLGAHPSHKQK